jgi:hypothetical protein
MEAFFEWNYPSPFVAISVFFLDFLGRILVSGKRVSPNVSVRGIQALQHRSRHERGAIPVVAAEVPGQD